MFWFLDGLNRVNGPQDVVSLEVYRAFPGFTRKASLNLSETGKDGPGQGWLEYFRREVSVGSGCVEVGESLDGMEFVGSMLPDSSAWRV